MNRTRIALSGIVVLSIATHAMAAGSSAGHGSGGRLAEFGSIVNKYKYNASGEEFRITGHCQSSGTMFLGIRNVCVEPRAQLLFHAYRRQSKIDPSMTALMASYYNERLRDYLTSHGWLNTLGFHTMSSSQVIGFGYRACR